ncbi:MAG: hypothetical protein IPN12_11315 [Rhodocyclaceae bacterium]|nr:hypothetical protein [Rhodocyclaceae bacterium]MBK9311302.1 hypothetical protein [Rhodocyclaceae bacterium]
MVIAGTVLALMNARCLPTKKISLQSGISSKSDLFVSPLKRMPFHNVPFVSAIDYIRARISLKARAGLISICDADGGWFRHLGRSHGSWRLVKTDFGAYGATETFRSLQSVNRAS